MEFPVMLVLILATITFATVPAYSQKIYASENPLAVGSNVTFFSEAVVTTGVWTFDSDVIVYIIPGRQIVAKAWRDRIAFNSTTSSLTITSLQVEDSGLYKLQDPDFSVQIILSVQVPISNVTLSAKSANLVEFNDTAVLMCSASSGTSLSYVWMKGNSVVTTGGTMQLSDGGATLTIASVTRYDEGPFTCNVSNGISFEKSLPVHLNISYGPSNTTMMVMPMKYVYIAGSNITLSCSAESSPPAMIQWMVDGMYLNQFGPQLQLQGVTESNSGNYKCLLHNTVTAMFSSSSAMIRILEPIAAVAVNHTGGPAILHQSFTLHCEVTGSVDSIWWWKNGRLISPDNTTVFDMDKNKTLILNPVQKSDSGDYRCQAFNMVSNLTSSAYNVEVSYGPMTPLIMGPSMALTGTKVTLNCSSASHPPSQISWYFNDSLVASTSTLTIGPLTFNMSGKYICMAFNKVTGKNSTAYMMLAVVAPVTMASIKVVGAQPILNHSFTLTCETTGNVESITWMSDWSPLYPTNTRQLSMDNATLTFDPVMHYDNGYYQCVASNSLSNFTSETFMLDVFYGPEKPTIMGPNVVKAGHSVTLICNASSNPPGLYKWFFNDSQVANTSDYVTLPLTGNMSGMYICKAYNNITSKFSTAYTMLTVVDPIVDVQVEAPMNPAIEGQSYMLACKVMGPADHIYWKKNGEPLHDNYRLNFTMDNKTVTINTLERGDSGHYQCTAINAAWNMTSPSYELLVNFGPETLTIDGPAFAQTGRKAIFHCSAESVPPSHFSWWFNGSRVSNSSMFTTSPLSLNMTGEYVCMAYNYVTGKNSTNSTMLTVIEAIESVVIRTNTIPISSENFTLTCYVTGPYDEIYWMKNNMQLDANISTAVGNMSYHIEKNMLHFTPVTMYNDGTYQCVATNQAGPNKSPQYMLLVNYGPLSVDISGPNSAELGRIVSLTCSADSRPDCDFYWFFNHSTALLHTGSEITFFTTNESEGTYTCKARNPVTNITMYQTKMFAVDHASVLCFPSRVMLMLMGLFASSFTVLLN